MMRFQLEAGFATSIERNSLTVSALYDFSASGPGTFTFDPVLTFKVTGVDDTSHIEKANGRSASITVANDVSEHNLGKREIQCGGFEGLLISAGRLEASELANTAISYIKSHGSDEIFKDYFADSDPQRIIKNFNYITTIGPDEPTMYCNSDPYNQCGVFSNSAYTFRIERKIWYCDGFYTQAHLDWLCESWVGEERFLGGTTLAMLAFQLIPDVTTQLWTCHPTGYANIAINTNYSVSTRTLHELLGAGALTRGCDLRSALLSKSTRRPGASDRRPEGREI